MSCEEERFISVCFSLIFQRELLHNRTQLTVDSLSEKMLGSHRGNENAKYNVLHHYSLTVDLTVRRKTSVEYCLFWFYI